ncbi:rieske (2Fe-2S) domain-containing protein [Actinidia rufa]|uniref:Rieske (2Fe-2S) domain-containing protein n=1 Tax=Actinidia rufa TaxID=165716 RepID=A0A7J0GG95_9ERIC|nr:rieske (2Fe-2S) domain-containing protein [Actinidia rufa]
MSSHLLYLQRSLDGCIVCPTTDSTFDLRTGAIKEWYPKNPVLRVLTPALRTLFVYPVKTDDENIYISIRGGSRSDASAEIVFSGKAQPGITATDVNVDEVRMVVDEDLEGFGFTGTNELINGKAAVIGFLLLLDFELLTGKGLLKGTGSICSLFRLHLPSIWCSGVSTGVLVFGIMEHYSICSLFCLDLPPIWCSGVSTGVLVFGSVERDLLASRFGMTALRFGLCSGAVSVEFSVLVSV